MRKFNNIFVTHQKNSSTRKNAGPRLMSTSRDDRSSKCVLAFIVSLVFITAFFTQSCFGKYHRLLIEYIFHRTKTFTPKPHAKTVRCMVRTHALQSVSELKSDALYHSANLTVHIKATTTNILRDMILRTSFPN